VYYTDVDILEIVALVRRHLIVVVAICACGFGAAYALVRADPGYQEAGTVAIIAPQTANNMFADDGDLLVIESLLSQYLTSATAESRIRAVGGTGDYSVALVNESNEQFPYYKNPYIDITATSANPGVSQRTFTGVLDVMGAELSTLQNRQGVVPTDQVTAIIASQPGTPVRLSGSHVRFLLAMAMITVIVTLLSISVIDRRSRRRNSSPPVPRIHHSAETSAI
jgi:capsular polysaccharide biosynthesis protein